MVSYSLHSIRARPARVNTVSSIFYERYILNSKSKWLALSSRCSASSFCLLAASSVYQQVDNPRPSVLIPFAILPISSTSAHLQGSRVLQVNQSQGACQGNSKHESVQIHSSCELSDPATGSFLLAEATSSTSRDGCMRLTFRSVATISVFVSAKRKDSDTFKCSFAT